MHTFILLWIMNTHIAEPKISSEGPIDEALSLLADYVNRPLEPSSLSMQTARACLADAIGCAILALKYPACTKLLGPVVAGTVVPDGARVPGTSYILDPIRAAFNIGTLIRWLDYNDTWLAAEWGHPSDNLGGILAVADYRSRQRVSRSLPPLFMREVLSGMIKAYEVQGSLALLNSFNKVGFDHVILVKAATAAVAAHLLGATRTQIIDALSQAFIDAGPLRAYRHAPNTGSRKSWAAGDATSRGVQFAFMTMQGEMGYRQALTAKKWGLYDVLFKGVPFAFQRPLNSYVMDNILFKISYPAEFHAQTAVECAVHLHPAIVGRLDDIVSIHIETHAAAMCIINKTGQLNNPADRDHCLQYMAALPLLYGTLSADHYEDAAAADKRIDVLREKMVVTENQQFTLDYLDPDKRSIANSMVIHFADGSKTEKVAVEYPLGHRRRRAEGLPLLFRKLEDNLSTHFSAHKVATLMRLLQDQNTLEDMPVQVFMELFTEAFSSGKGS